MANEHLLGVPDGDTQATFTVDLRDYEPGENRASGHLANGRYEAEIIGAAIVNKKERSGKNVAFRFAALPSRVNLRAFHPAPVGEPGNKEYDAGMRNLRDLVWSIATATGLTDKAKAQPLTINPAWFVGKRCFLRVDDEEYNGRTVSRITAYITKTEFDASPGADDVMPSASRPQPSIPEVLPSGIGPTDGAKKAIDRVLGF